MNLKLLLLCSILGISVSVSVAQNADLRTDKNSLQATQKLQQLQVNLQKKGIAVEEMQINEMTNTAGLVSFTKGSIKADRVASLIREILVEKSNAPQDIKHELLRVDVDKNSFAVQRYQQYFKGIKVEQGTTIVAIKDGSVAFMNNEFYDIAAAVSAIPSLTEAQALQAAEAFTGAKSYMYQAIQQKMAEKGLSDAQLQRLQTEYNENSPKGELVWVRDYNNIKDPTLRLAYKFDVYATEPVSRNEVFVDAQDGHILFKNAIIHHLTPDFSENNRNEKAGFYLQQIKAQKETAQRGTPTLQPNFLTATNTALVAGEGDTRYNGPNKPLRVTSLDHDANAITPNQFVLNGDVPITTNGVSSNVLLETKTMEGNGVPNLSAPAAVYDQAVHVTNSNNDTNFDDVPKGFPDEVLNDDVALDAHWGSEEVVNYWADIHNRKSYDGTGKPIYSYVHYSVQYDNAFWNGRAMTYGDGMSFRSLTSLDVCGHEIGHGVCSNTSNLAYQLESGAMNEGFSDIWAACVENYVQVKFPAPTDLAIRNLQPWGIGEQIDKGNTDPLDPDGPTNNPNYQALRRMDFPLKEANPDTYGGTSWTSQVNCSPFLGE